MINVQARIDEAIRKSSGYKTAKRDGSKFHVSDAGTCYRKRVLKRLGIAPTRDIPTPNLRKMVAGDAGHDKLQSLLQANHSLMMAEGEIDTEHIKGHYDGIIRDDDGAKALIEFKTIEKWGMSHIIKDGAKPEHELQMFTYWDHLRKDFTNLEQAVLVYVKREDFGARDFHYWWSPDIPQKVANEWGPLLKYWVDKELPPCTCHKDYGGYGVKYCPYQDDDEHCCSPTLTEDQRKELSAWKQADDVLKKQ